MNHLRMIVKQEHTVNEDEPSLCEESEFEQEHDVRLDGYKKGNELEIELDDVEFSSPADNACS